LRRGALAVATATALLAVAGCGGSTSAPATVTPAASAPAAFPVTVTGANGPVTLATQPERIVSLSPTATEMLFAIGAGPQVEAVDDQSNFPAEAPLTDLSGFTPNAEAIAGYQPDLVVLANDTNDILSALTALDLPVLHLPAAATLAESYEQMLALGSATGHGDDAQKVVEETEQRIAVAVASVPKPTAPMRVYHELDNTYYSATSTTFIGGVYALFGLENIADRAKDDAGGYPQLSAEFVVTQKPDLIVLADTKCCQQTPETVAKRPAFGDLPAVQSGRVLAADDDIASRWGPRVADFAESVAAELAA
jgi:iron complex transport system substrate-binding protein